MAYSQFSETQFVFGYLKELYFKQAFFYPWNYFMFPSTIVEKMLPVDFYVDCYSHSEFYQFKRSEYLSARRGIAEINAGVPISFLDYYRFKIYNKTTATKAGQFDKLRELALHFPNDLVCYCAPCFHTDWEFHNFFVNNNILDNSILIECNQFNQASFNIPNFDINDGIDHYMVFKPTSNLGYLCSEPKEIKITKPLNNLEKVRVKTKSFKNVIKTLYNEIYLKDEFNFYYEDHLENNSRDIMNIKKPFSDDLFEQIRIVHSYLLTQYNIIWQPQFNVK